MDFEASRVLLDKLVLGACTGCLRYYYPYAGQETGLVIVNIAWTGLQ